MLVYSGNTSLDQHDIADLEGTGECTPISESGSTANEGTCIAPIRDVLNNHYDDLPYANYFITYRLDDTSESDAYDDYSAITDYSIYNHGIPFLQLIDPKPCDEKTVLPGWENTSSCNYRHYVVARGCDGLYDGTYGSRSINVNDTAWWTWSEEIVDLQDIAYMVYEADGYGGCDADLKNIVY